jgi:hypothetical protein
MAAPLSVCTEEEERSCGMFFYGQQMGEVLKFTHVYMLRMGRMLFLQEECVCVDKVWASVTVTEHL